MNVTGKKKPKKKQNRFNNAGQIRIYQYPYIIVFRCSYSQYLTQFCESPLLSTKSGIFFPPQFHFAYWLRLKIHIKIDDR